MHTIFVSSTFADMQRERDILRDVVAAKVNAEARKHNDHIEFCDLRWGISTENMEAESASKKVLDVCLDEIDRSNPPIIILLGERYGWIPDEQLIASVTERRNIVLEILRISATALEAEYGAICEGRKALVYFREIDCQAEEIPEVFQKEDEMRRKLLDILKSRLSAQANCRIRKYKVRIEGGELIREDLDAFAEIVRKDLVDAFQDDWKRFEAMTPFQRERERQWAFIREKASMFSARELDANRLIEKIKSSQTTLCKGPSGSGKSMLCSHISLWAKSYGWDVLPFIGGLTDESNDAMDVLRNTAYFLEDALGMEHFSNATAHTLKEINRSTVLSLDEWQSRLLLLGSKYAATGKKLLVLVDAIDQLFPDEVREKCGFIPDGLSSSVRFFLTALPDTNLPIENVYVLQPLTREDQHKVVNGVLKRHGKELALGVVNRLLAMESASNPFYVSMAVQRLKMMDETSFEEVRSREKQEGFDNALAMLQTEILERCPGSIDGMCVELFAEAGRRIDDWLIREVSNYIASSRYGLRRSDLAALLSEDWNELKFAHLLNYLQEDFQVRPDGRVDFMHKTVRVGLLKKLGENRSYDIDIAKYLDGLHPHDQVRMDEIIYHVIHANNADYFLKYLNQYELGEHRDQEIITCAAACVRYICLTEGTDWLEDILEEAKTGSFWVSLYWFAINELSDTFEPSLVEQECNRRILLKVDEQLEQLDAMGRLTVNNNRAFVKRMVVAIQPVLSLSWLVSGDSRFNHIVEKYLDLAKSEFNASDGSVYQRWMLLRAYFRAMHVFRATEKEKSTRDGMTLAGGAVRVSRNTQIDSKFGERSLSGIKIAEEGMALLDNELISYDGALESRILPTYFQYLGDFYKHLGHLEKSLGMYQMGVGLLNQNNLSKKTAKELLELGDACASVGAAYIALNDRARSSANYTKAITCYEYAFRNGSVDDSRWRKIADSYWCACWIYFANPKDVVFGSDLCNQATLWGYQGCDLLRRHFHVFGDKSDRVAWTENVTLVLMNTPVSKDISKEVVGKLKSWVAEDETRYLLDDNQNNRGALITSCNASARIITNSKLEDYYDFAISCCDKGISASKTPAHLTRFASTERGNISTFNEIKCVIGILRNPNSEEPLLARVNSELELEEKHGAPSAQLGEACFNLSSFYFEHKNHQNAKSIVTWCLKAAECGHVRAQYNLGLFYDRGDGVAQDHSEAAKWFRKAAEQGYADAQYNLGYDYAHGEGVEQNWEEAVVWYKQAAAQGHAKAQCDLGFCFACGKGVAQDYHMAAEWYRKAAEQGHVWAQLSLGNIYKDGRGGVERNLDEAISWFQKATAQGSDEGRRLLDESTAAKMIDGGSRIQPRSANSKNSLQYDEEHEYYRSLVLRSIHSLEGVRAPKLAKTVSSVVLNNAVANYAPMVRVESIVAIDGSGFPSKGKRGVLYTNEGICSSELQHGTFLRFSQIDRVSYHGDNLCFQMKDGSKLIADFGAYQNTVYEVVSRVLEMSRAR